MMPPDHNQLEVGGSSALRISDVEILDAASGRFLPRSDLLIVNGRIAAPSRKPPGLVAEDLIDGSQLTAFPGFVDAHFHCSYAGHVGVAQLEELHSPTSRIASATSNLTSALEHGITSALDVGSHGRIAVSLRDGQRIGSIEGPRMLVSGQIIVKSGGPMDLPQTAQSNERLFRVVRNQRELEAAIVEQASWGVDAVKIQISASAVQTDEPPRECSFSEKELRSAVVLSHEMGLLLGVHAEGDGPIREALRAGVDVVHHGSFASLDTLREIRASGTGLVFTPGVYRAIARNGPALGYPPDGLKRVVRHWGAILRTIQDAAEAQVPFGVGSDTGGAVHPHGEYLEDVICLVNDCHLPSALALAVATRGAAIAARMDEAGTIVPGGRADLVLASSESVHFDIEALRRSSNLTVIQGGCLRRSATE